VPALDLSTGRALELRGDEDHDSIKAIVDACG
jgi:hypothetical protein